jgi:hypothetical protein
MRSSTFIVLLGYLCCGLLLTTQAAPSLSVGSILMKRAGHQHGAAHKPAGAPHKKEFADVSTLLRQRDTLAFNAEFDDITQFDKAVFSSVQLEAKHLE